MARALRLAIATAAPFAALFLACCGRTPSLDSEHDAGGGCGGTGGTPDASLSDSGGEDATADAEREDALPDDGAPLAVTPMVDTNGMVSCGIRTNGTLVCWGGVATFFGAPPAGTFRQLSLGSVGCAVRTDGTLACWGTAGYVDDRQALRSPPDGRFVEVSVGVIHACAVRTDGAIECWGKGQEETGSCGVELLEYGGSWCGQTTPLSGTFLHVASGYLHTCAIRSDGTLACWGAGTNGFGQPEACPWTYGGEPRVYRCGQSSPPAGTFVALSAAEHGNCAIRTDGTLACWGAVEGLTSAKGEFSQLSVERFGGCAIRRTGELLCDMNVWSGSRPSPDGQRFRQVSVAVAGGCGIREAGSAVCWGLPCTSTAFCDEQGWLDPPADFP